MMSKRFISLSILIASAGLLSFAAACSSSSSGSSGTPTPTPIQYTDCGILWETKAGSKAHPANTAYADIGFLQTDISKWAAGSQTYSKSSAVPTFIGAEIDHKFATSTTPGTSAAVAIATNGTYTLTLGATAPKTGHSVTFADTDNAKKFFDGSGSGTALGAKIGSNGNASFTGVTSPLSAGAFVTGQIALGQGSFSIKVLGSSYTIDASSSTAPGVTVSYCEDAAGNGFAPVTIDEIIDAVHQAILARDVH